MLETESNCYCRYVVLKGELWSTYFYRLLFSFSSKFEFLWCFFSVSVGFVFHVVIFGLYITFYAL